MAANSKSGLSTITAIAVIGHPQIIKSKLIQLDCQIYLGLEGADVLIGSVKFFNKDDLSFDEPKLYFVETTFAQVPDNNSSLALPKNDYDFVGDIQWLYCFGDVSSDDTVIPTVWPYVHASGLAMNCNKKDATFTLDIDVWVSSLLKVEPGTTPPPKPIAPFLCSIPDSPKYKYGNKPTPFEKRFVAVHGFIMGVTYKNDGSIERFKVSVDQIDFLGGLSEAAAGGSAILNKLDTLSSTPRTKGFAWIRYGQNGSQVTPPNKRPRIDADAASTPAKPFSQGLSARQLEKQKALAD